MDYHSIHGHDVASFDISSSHRLPTVTASAALEELDQNKSVYISTGLGELDKHLQDVSRGGSQNHVSGGVKRGQVTEIWGPPGTGKTALGLQIASNARLKGQDAVWIDCFQDLSTARAGRVFQAPDPNQSQASSGSGSEDNGEPAALYHYACLTLPHLVALISRPTPKIVPKNTSILVIDSVTALINSTLPRGQDGKPGLDLKRGPNSAIKRRQALQSIMKSLQALASTKNVAVVLLSQCATKMQPERGATLTPAINANLWEQGLSTRVVLFKDWQWFKGKPKTIHLAGVQKVDGRSANDALDVVSAFKIGLNGIFSVPYEARHTSGDARSIIRPKRKLAQTDFEVPDSEDDEDYGWAEDDESAMPPPPPQWQGSEDILLGQEVGRSDDEGEAQDEECEHESAEE